MRYTQPSTVPADVIDSRGPGWKVETIAKFVANELMLPTGQHLTKRAKDMNTDYETAAKIAENATKMFMRSHDELCNTTLRLQDTAKKASGNVRKAADDLAQGIVRIQKQADFNNLERYVNLLERAATAMTLLADLEKSGKLDKIAGALK